MLNGLWHVVFQVPGDHGGGVVVINDGTALGGDAACTYIGAITEVGGAVGGLLAIKHVNKASPALIPQLPNYTIKIEGSVNGGSLQLVGTVQEAPGAPKISIIGSKQVDI